MAKPKNLDAKINALSCVVEKSFAAIAEDVAHRPTNSSVAGIVENVVGPLLDKKISPAVAELASIRRDLEGLRINVENLIGYRKEIDHALERNRRHREAPRDREKTSGITRNCLSTLISAASQSHACANQTRTPAEISVLPKQPVSFDPEWSRLFDTTGRGDRSEVNITTSLHGSETEHAKYRPFFPHSA